MKIAVTYENGNVFQHFGHTEKFKIYEVEDGTVKSAKVVDTDGKGHGALADFLKNLGVTVLICGGIGGGAQSALKEAGIEFYGGVQGSTDMAVVAFVANSLKYNPDIKCSHHDGEHGHTCGDHGCSH